MGVISRMREVSPYLLALFAIVFIGFMVATDADIQHVMLSGENPATAVIGKVNGEKIRYAEFNERLQRQLEQQRQMSPNAEVDEAGIRQAIWESFVEELLLRQAASEVGFPVTAEELRDVLLENPPEYLKRAFTDTAGQFYRERYIELVTQPERLAEYIDPNSGVDPIEAVQRWKQDLLQVEDFLRASRERERLRSLANLVGSITSPTYVRRQYMVENSSAEVNYVVYSIERIPDREVTVTDAELEEYYRRNRERFKQKESRKLKYVIFPLEPQRTGYGELPQALAAHPAGAGDGFQSRFGLCTAAEPVPGAQLWAEFRLLRSTRRRRSTWSLSPWERWWDRSRSWARPTSCGWTVGSRAIHWSCTPATSSLGLGAIGTVPVPRRSSCCSGRARARISLLWRGSTRRDRGTAERGGDLGWFPRGAHGQAL
jgi:hypothetical protein